MGEVWERGREGGRLLAGAESMEWRGGGGGIRKRWCTASPLIVLRMRSSAPAWHSAFLDTGGMTMVFASGTGSDLI